MAKKYSKLGRGRHPMTAEVWSALVDAFRNAPGAHVHAARVARVDRRTAKKAWEKGMAGWEGGKSIKGLFEEEQVAARARLLESQDVARRAAEAERAKAREQAIESRKVEGQVVALARTNSLQSLAAAAEMLRAARDLGARVKDKLKQMLDDDKAVSDGAQVCEHCGRGPQAAPPSAIINLLDRITMVGGRVSEIAAEVMRMERLHLGEPMAIIAVEDAGGISLQDAEMRLKIAVQAVEGALHKKVVGAVVERVALSGSDMEIALGGRGNGRPASGLRGEN